MQPAVVAYFILTVLQCLDFLPCSCESPYSAGPDYYWREYNGIVPLDAFQGGKSGGKPLYIGQGHFGGTKLLPGTLTAGSTNLMITANFKTQTLNKYVKILSTSRPYMFKWIKVSNKNITELQNHCHLVLGGTEAERDVYIGRTIHEGHLYIGKIYIYPPPELCLPITHGNMEIRYTEYEVLTYNCDFKRNSCTNYDIDFRIE